MRFIDSAAIKRFLIKCRIYPSDSLLIAVIRRLDLDADARLCYQEFRDGIMPMENFTKGSLKMFEKTIEAKRPRRPVSAIPKTKLPSKISNTLHGKDTEQARLHLKQDDVYQKGYQQLIDAPEAAYTFNTKFEAPASTAKPAAATFAERLEDQSAEQRSSALVQRFNSEVIREMIGVLKKLE